MEKNDNIVDTIIAGSKQGLTLAQIIDKYLDKQKLPSSARDLITKEFEFNTQFFPNYPIAHGVLEKKFIMDLQSGDYYIYDEKLRHRTSVQKASLLSIFNPKSFQKLQDTRLYTVCLGYNPDNPTLFYEHKGMPYLNLYRPAPWQFPYMYEGKEVPNTALPERYKDFFMHICDNVEDSYNYLIHFLAATVQPNYRPQSYLALLGRQGVGKNTLIDIMAAVLDKENVCIFQSNSLKDERFNAPLKDRKLIFFDEVQVKTDSDERFLKEFINPEVQIEEKGRDKKTYTNFATVIMAANSLAAIRTSSDDRRYSFLDLPNKTLLEFHKEKYTHVGTLNHYRTKYLLDEESIKQLGEYLLNIKVDVRLLSEPLKSKAKLKHKRDSLNDWEIAIFDTLAPQLAGQTVSINKANEKLQEITNNSKVKPGRERWKQLSQHKPGYFKRKKMAHKDGGQEYVIVFEPLESQPKETLDEETD